MREIAGVSSPKRIPLVAICKTINGNPVMKAMEVKQEFINALNSDRYKYLRVNFANGDMVGHTGNFDAARIAIEVVDENVGTVVGRLLELDAHILITADHGNSEEMVDPETGMVKTSHTLNPVECIYVAGDSLGAKLLPRGKLADIAPTILGLLGLAVPEEMTADNLIFL